MVGFATAGSNTYMTHDMASLQQGMVHLLPSV